MYALAFCFGSCELWDIQCSARSASSVVQHLLCGKQNRGKGVATFVDYRTQAQESCYERIRCTCKQVCKGRCKCFKAACCAQPCAYVVRTVTATRQVSWQGRGSSANEVIVSSTVYNWLTVYIICHLTIWSFEIWSFLSRNTAHMNGFNQLSGHNHAHLVWTNYNSRRCRQQCLDIRGILEA